MLLIGTALLLATSHPSSTGYHTLVSRATAKALPLQRLRGGSRTTPNVPKPVRGGHVPRMPTARRATAEAECRVCLQEGADDNHPTFHLGLGTFRVPMAMHAGNRAKLAERMGSGVRGVALLQGGDQTTRYDTDHEPVFRQESYFQYLFGVSEGGCYGALSLPEGKATLFIPKLGVDYEVFCGKYPSTDDFKTKYGVDDVKYLDELPGWLENELKLLDEHPTRSDRAQAAADGEDKDDALPSKLYLLHGLNSDSGNYAVPATIPGSDDHLLTERTELTTLFDALAECRVTKSHAEVELMRYVNYVSSMAHVEVRI